MITAQTGTVLPSCSIPTESDVHGSLSRYIHRFIALLALIMLVLVAARLLGAYVFGRVDLAAERAEIERSYRELLDRRVDISVLQTQLTSLNTSRQVRASTIDAPNDHSALIKLQQLVRMAVDGVKGKLLSAIESATGQQQDVVRLLVRARVTEVMAPQLFSGLENGNPRLRIDEVTLIARPNTSGEPPEVEATMAVSAQWIANKASP